MTDQPKTYTRETLNALADECGREAKHRRERLMELCEDTPERAHVMRMLARQEALEAALRQCAEMAWKPIETAPKGEITEDVGNRGSSEWFLGLNIAGDIRKIRRLPEMHSFTWIDGENTHYAAEWFTHWMPLPTPPAEGGDDANVS